MTDSEALDVLHAAARGRRRRVFWSWSGGALVIGLLSFVPNVWFFGESWGQALLDGAAWVVLGVACGWVFSAGDALASASASVESVVEAEVAEVDDQKITVCTSDGGALVWSVERPSVLPLESGRGVWVGSPVRRGKYLLVVVPHQDQEPTVLWPAEPAWTPGRWD